METIVGRPGIEYCEVPGWIHTSLIYFPTERVSLGESMGIEVLAGHLQDAGINASVNLLDMQEDVVKYGRVIISDLVNKTEENKDKVIGLSIPQGSWNYALSFLIQLEERFAQNEQDLPLVVLGNGVPTRAYKDILRMFPWVVIFRGESEEAFTDTISKLSKGEEIIDVKNFVYLENPSDPDSQLIKKDYQPPAVDLKYPLPDRRLLKDLILKNNGITRIEASRGCPKAQFCGGCSFCPRMKEHWRTIPVEKVLDDLNVIKEVWLELRSDGLGPESLKIEFTDEEFLGYFDHPEGKILDSFDFGANRKRIEDLINGVGTGEAHKNGLKELKEEIGLSFSISARTDCFLQADNIGLIDKLQNAGLKKVYFGVEGGCDGYLEDLMKGTTVKTNDEAIERARLLGLDVELGFITFSWRMNFEQLGNNLDWLGRVVGGKANFLDTSSVLNELDVMVDSPEEGLLRNYLQARGIDFETYRKEHFNINLCRIDVEGADYKDKKVWQVVEPLRRWKDEQKRVYFALKSLERALVIDGFYTSVVDFLERFKELDYLLAREIYRLVDSGEDGDETEKALQQYREERHKVVKEVGEFAQQGMLGGAGVILQKEVRRFMEEEVDRGIVKESLEGIAAVIVNPEGKILLVRARGEDEWGFVGEKRLSDESLVCTTRRGFKEELDIFPEEVDLFFNKIESYSVGVDVDGRLYHDQGGAKYKQFTLYHVLVKPTAGFRGIDLKRAGVGVENVDAIWLTPEEIRKSRLKLKKNVLDVIKQLEQIPA